MNTTRNHARLNDLAREITQLEAQVIETERSALDCIGSEESAVAKWESVMMIRAALDRALRAYFVESEVVRTAELARAAAGRQAAA